jgi:hypothetical protein
MIKDHAAVSDGDHFSGRWRKTRSFGGTGFGGEAGVYPGGVGFEGFVRRRRAVLFDGGGDPAEAHRADEAVELEGTLADQLRETSVPGAAPELHLEKAILGVYVALGEEQIPLVPGEDVRHSEAVPQDLYGIFEARKLNHALKFRQ